MGDVPWLRMDMHCHTNASFDCLSRPADVVRTARERGLDRLVITDHNRIEGALRCRELDPDLILVGEEVKTRERIDIIGILLRERIPRGTPAAETCERIRDQGGVVYMPHPFDTRRAGGGRMVEELAELIDVVEAHNARSSPSRNREAAAWAASHGKPTGAGSDAHTLREIGRGVLELPAFEATRDAMLSALADARFARRTHSSPTVSVWSTWAKLRKAFPGGV
jgi:predicted metal-dependent phosphoesterase TrpH